MSTEFGAVGWFKDEEENHDKIWGFFYRPTPQYDEEVAKYGAARVASWRTPRNVVVFWGRRGKAMQFKADISTNAERTARTKFDKGYMRINASQLTSIWPTFEDEKNLKLSFEVLAGNVK